MKNEENKTLKEEQIKEYLAKSLTADVSENKTPVMSCEELHNVAGANTIEAGATIDVKGTLELIPEEQIREYLESKRKEKSDERLREEVAITYYQKHKAAPCVTIRYSNGMCNVPHRKLESVTDAIELFKNVDITIVQELDSLYRQVENNKHQSDYERGFSDALDPKRRQGEH